MESFRVEYLLTVGQKEPFCRNIETFNNLMEIIEGVTLKNNSIEYKSLKIHYEVQTGEIAVDKQRYFHIKLIHKHEDVSNEFEELLKALRAVLHKISDRGIQSLWDDIGFHYAQKAYPVIFELENVMRKLLTKFMLTNVGNVWTNESIPQEVAESIRTKTNKNSLNYLYEADFIQLSKYIFNAYAILDARTFTEKIRLAKTIEDLKLEELKRMVPKSNWERYFSSLLNCESEYLRIRWEKLYERRNQIAHNKSMTRIEFEETIGLVNEIQPKLLDAIAKLDQITVPQEDRESVAENAAETSNASVGEYLQIWKALLSDIYNLSIICLPAAEKKEITGNRYTTTKLINLLHKSQVLKPDFRPKIQELLDLRNFIVHETDILISDQELSAAIDKAHLLRVEVFETTESFLSEILNKKGKPPEDLNSPKDDKNSDNNTE